MLPTAMHTWNLHKNEENNALAPSPSPIHGPRHKNVEARTAAKYNMSINHKHKIDSGQYLKKNASLGINHSAHSILTQSR